MTTSWRHRHIPIDDTEFHVVEGGAYGAPCVLFLHGWPQNWSAFKEVMTLAEKKAYVVAIDLPGIGESTTRKPFGSKYAIAGYVHKLITKLKLSDVTLVGHDVGGQVVFAYLKRYRTGIERAVIMDVAIPGVSPWEEVRRNPAIWHFGFHAVPKLPEALVQGKQQSYFDFFFQAIAARPATITAAARRRYAAAYASPAALQTGFEWYRAFPEDAKRNEATMARVTNTPVLYIRGRQEYGDIAMYATGLRQAHVRNLTTAIIPACGHYAPEEQPEAVWQQLEQFIGVA